MRMNTGKAVSIQSREPWEGIAKHDGEFQMLIETAKILLVDYSHATCIS